MAYICERCGKGSLNILRVSHAKNRSHRRAKPNLHWHRIAINGVTKRMRLCTKCIRTVKKEMKVKEEAMKIKMAVKQAAIEAKEKAKREVKMEKKAVEQKARKARSATKREKKEKTAPKVSK